MTRNAIYALEKLTMAVTILATNPSEIRDRLRAAAIEIMLIPIEDVPAFERVDEDIRWVQAQLIRKVPEHDMQSSISASLHGMRKKRGTEIAERIVEAEAKLRAYVNGQLQSSCGRTDSENA